jgi:putative addiction module component (TIGR02574 family)
MEAGELLKHALTLSDRERAELASHLIDSLDPTVEPDAELAWQEGIARRLEEVESGRVKTIPWDKVQRKGRALRDMCRNGVHHL